MNEKKFQPRRLLGRTGFMATQLGIGDLADRSVPIEQCVATARRALDAGLNVIDTAPSYEDGYSEQIVGRAVKGRRDKIFLIDKIDHHDEPVGPQLENSLRLLEEDHVDLMVFHGLSSLDGWQKVAAAGGGMEQLAAQVKAGKVRFRGISSHNPQVLVEAINSGLCDVVMFAVGPFCDERYIKQVIPLTRQKNVGTVCFKTFGAGKLLGDTTGYGQPLQERPRGKFSSGGSSSQDARPELPCLTAGQCVRYTLSIDPDVALLGMSFPNEQDAAFAAARDFKPMSSEELAETRKLAVDAMQQKGDAWWNPK